jgi:hypothetical protein
VKPILRTMQAFRTAVARELPSKRCTALYDAGTGREILDPADLCQDMWYIASAGKALQPIPSGSPFFSVVLNSMKVC